MPERIKKIALIGPESSGKTTLCKELAGHFKTVWVPEYARNYIARLQRKYTLQDIEHCAREQLRAEDELMQKANRFLFCDSELIIAKVWCEDVFKVVPEWINELVESHRYDLYLLTQADIDFKPDPVRENPHRREFFFNWYRREMESRKFPYEIISGQGKQRFENAERCLSRHFPTQIQT